MVPTTSGGGTAGGWSSVDVVEMRPTPVERHGLARQQTTDDDQQLLQRDQPVRRAGVDLAHPGFDSVADTGGHPAGIQLGDRRQLHRQDRRVANRHREQPDADADPLGRREDRGRAGDAAVQEAVLDQPQLVEPGRVERTAVRHQFPVGHARQRGADRGHWPTGVQEQEVFGKIAEARSKLLNAQQQAPQGEGGDKTPEQKQAVIDAANSFGGTVGRLLVLQEAYPQLRSNENFLKAQDEVVGTENRIAISRKDYNDAIQDYNTTMKSFPTVISAKLYGFKEEPYFKADPAATTVPKIDANSLRENPAPAPAPSK